MYSVRIRQDLETSTQPKKTEWNPRKLRKHDRPTANLSAIVCSPLTVLGSATFNTAAIRPINLEGAGLRVTGHHVFLGVNGFACDLAPSPFEFGSSCQEASPGGKQQHGRRGHLRGGHTPIPKRLHTSLGLERGGTAACDSLRRNAICIASEVSEDSLEPSNDMWTGLGTQKRTAGRWQRRRQQHGVAKNKVPCTRHSVATASIHRARRSPRVGHGWSGIARQAPMYGSASRVGEAHDTSCACSLGPRPESAGGRGVQPAFVLQNRMHSRLAGSRGDGVEGKELARALCAATAMMLLQQDTYRPHAKPTEWQHAHPEEPEESCGLGIPAATDLDSEHNEVAARRARQLGVGDAYAALLAEGQGRVPGRGSPERVTGLTGKHQRG